MFGFLKKAKEFVVTNAVAVKNAVVEEISDVMKESKEIEEQHKKEEESEKSAKLPWEGLKLSANSNGNYTDIIKEEVLALSADEKNFLIDEENYMFEFDFNIERYKFQAMKVMEVDERLGLLRNTMVPKVIDDIKFWKNYFYQIEIIKLKYSNNNETGFKNVVNEDAQLESEEIEVDIDQLEQRAMKEREKELIEKKVGSKGDLPKPEKNQEESKENEVKASNPPGKSNEANEAENENLDIEIKL